MKLSDQIRIEAPRSRVYAALNDPEVLKRAIPGCQLLAKVSENELEATVTAKIGPVKATFKGRVTLSDLDPPAGYTISGQGTGGAAGFAKGSARVSLTEDGQATILKYDVDADVGGKLAQLGGRLIEGTSKKLAGEFFQAFQAALAAPAPTAGPAPAAAAHDLPAAAGLPAWIVWVVSAAIVAAVAALMLLMG
jgi:hypothetical protein